MIVLFAENVWAVLYTVALKNLVNTLCSYVSQAGQPVLDIATELITGLSEQVISHQETE